MYVLTRRVASGEIKDRRYQAEIHINDVGVFFSRRVNRASSAKREAEDLFGLLDWRAAEIEGANQIAEIDSKRISFAVAVVRVSGGWQAQLRQDAGGNHLFFSRTARDSNEARRIAETAFGVLRWQTSPDWLRQRDPAVASIAYWPPAAR